MPCNQFTAPNGAPSLLYEGLNQKYGEDKALQIWSYANSPAFKGLGTKDPNGEPSLQSVEMAMNNVQAQPKLVTAMQTPKMEQLFNKFFKSNPDKFYAEVTAVAGKQQVEWLKDYIQREQPTNYTDLAVGLAAEMSYTVQINTAMQEVKYDYNSSDPEWGPNGEALKAGTYPSFHYSNLTVAGGTNYTENEISTPAIVPNLIGHAAFSTDNGIGWFRSDEQSSEYSAEDDEYLKQAQEEFGNSVATNTGIGSKTRRILELQSDLFQKGRNKTDLTYMSGTSGYLDDSIPAFSEEDIKQNNFLQLLNKDNNWITFFVKSIVQDSAKNGYENILFPAGETAAKIEGLETLANAIRVHDESIADARQLIEDAKNDPHIDVSLQEGFIKEAEQKKAELKAQGIEKLKPIEGFYETRVQNVLIKQYGKDNISRITDEHGNDWFQVSTKHGMDLINFNKDVEKAGDSITIKAERFKATSLEKLEKVVSAVYQEARANPGKQFIIPLTPTDTLWFEDKAKLTGAQLANLLDKDDTPPNVVFQKSMFSLMQNLPKNFVRGQVMEDSNPLDLDPESVRKQMDLSFAHIRDGAGRLTGKYFDPIVQGEILDTIIAQFHDILNNPNLEANREGKSKIKYVRDEITKRLTDSLEGWTEANDGLDPDYTPSVESQSMVDNLTNIVNSFFIKGEKNHLWNFAIEKLNSYKIKVKSGEIQETAGTTDTAYIEDENGDLQMEEGAITKDRGDSSFEMDMKDTASSRLKFWMLTTPESEYVDEKQPKEVDLYIKNDQTRHAIQSGKKTDMYLPAASAETLGLQPGSERTAMIDGKLMRVTATGAVTDDQLEGNQELADKIEKEEGRRPQSGDVALSLKPYVQTKGIVRAQKNFLGMNKLANLDETWQNTSALLANREPSLEGYLDAMKTSGNANIHQVANRLDKAIADGKDHIAKEFVSVMSAHYQRMLMVLMTKSKEGYLETTIIDSNRNSEVQTLQKFWQEAQKTSGMLSKNEAGQTIVDRQRAGALMNGLYDLYATAPNVVKLDTKGIPQSKIDEATKNHRKQQETDVEAYKQRGVEFFKQVLGANGIVMDDQAVADLFSDKDGFLPKYLSKGLSLNRVYGGMADGVPGGLVEVLVWRLNQAAKNEITPEKGELNNEDDTEAYKSNNPLYVENTAMRILAKAQLKYTPQVYSQTHKSAEGKTIYSFGLNSALSHAVRKFKEDANYRAQFHDSYFAQNSWLLQQLETSNLDKFQMVYLDGLKNRYGSRDGVTRPDMSDREQWLTMLGLFQNQGSDSLAHMVSLTHSDKTKTPLYMNAPRLNNILDRSETGKLRISPNTVDAIYRSVFLAEHNRMIQPGGEDIRGYEQGKKLFFLLPQFNYQQIAALQAQGVITAGELKAIWGDATHINTQDNALFEYTAKKIISHQLNAMIAETKKSWVDSKLMESGLPGSKWYYSRLLKEQDLYQRETERGSGKYEWMEGETPIPEEVVKALQTDLAAADYTVNSFLFNAGLSQLFYGDPALAFKNDLPSTLIEYGKRLAKDIAPGKDGEWSHSKSYISMTAKDYEPLVHELKQIQAYAAGKANATDAQEVTTVKEHLNVLYGLGRITKAQYTTALGIILKAKGGYYKFSPDLESIIMQPMKPVATGLLAPVNGVMGYDYVKSSSFPLYPPFTAGLELDRLRTAMEHPVTGVDRLNFISAKKIGAPVNLLTLYNADGKITEDAFTSPEWTETARQGMDRSNFRIQQDNPYDEDKDSILTVSQMNKNLTEKIPTILQKFNYRGQEMTGSELRQMKEDIRKQLITNSHQEFLSKVGATYNKATDSITFKDKRKFYDLMAQEAKNRDGYTVNDLLALTSYVESTDDLVVPLAFTPSSSRFEGLMMSMVKKIVKIKMPGHSFIQASPAGFRTLKTWDKSNLDRSQIAWTEAFNGNLQTAHLIDNTVAEGHTRLYRIEAKGAKPMYDPAGDWIKSSPEIQEREKYFGRWFTKDATDIDWYKKDREFNDTNSTTKYIDVPTADLDKYTGYDKKLSRKSEDEFVLPQEEVLNAKELKSGVQPAQVVVSEQYFENITGESIEKYIVKDANGARKIDMEKIPEGLLEMVLARIPNQGHSSMLPARIAGFAPKNMGDIMFVPAGITKQMGSDFDVDKIYSYHRIFQSSADGLSVQDDESNEGLKNQYFDVHWSALTNPEMLSNIMNPLDKNDLKVLAKELSAVKQIPYFFSPSYQLNSFQSKKSAKILVGKLSLAVTRNAVMQTSNVRLGEWNIAADQETGKNTKIVSLASISVADRDGHELKLGTLGGFGISTHTDGDGVVQVRTKGDNLIIGQSEALDDAKNEVLGKVNLNAATDNAYNAIHSLQTPDSGIPGTEDFVPGTAVDVEYSALLFAQSVIKEYAAALSTANDTLSVNFESKVKDKVFAELEAKYALPEGQSEMVLWNPEKLRHALTLKPGTEEFQRAQFSALQLFKEFDDVGSQLVTLQSTMAQDTRGAGPDLLNTLSVNDKRNQPNVSSPKFLVGTSGLFADTEVGTTYDKTIKTAIDLYTPELPYKQLQELYNKIQQHSGKDSMTDEKKKLIFNAVKSLVFSNKKLGLFTNAYTEKLRILFSTPGRPSLAVQLQQAKSTWGKNDYLLQRLQTDIDPDGVKPDMIQYNAAKASLADEVENSKAWLALLTSADEKVRTFGFDLIRYNYLIGGIQGTRNFVKFMPWAAIEGSQISFGLREQFEGIAGFNNSRVLIEQFFQHNPHEARQLSEDLKELGSPKVMPDSFLLPAYDVDNNKNNPAKNLAVEFTDPSGARHTDYPDYLSYRKDNKWMLFKNMGVIKGTNQVQPLFARIDLLGSSKLQLQEYASSAGEIGPMGVRSVIAENRAPWFENIEPDRYKLSNGMVDSLTSSSAITMAMRQVGIVKEQGTREDLNNSLAVISMDQGQPAHLRAMAGILTDMQRNSAEEHIYKNIFGLNDAFAYKFEDLAPGTSATFSSSMNFMRINKPTIGNKTLLAENIIHEDLHYHTAWLAMAMETPAEWKARELSPNTLAKLQQARAFIESNPELKAKLDTVDEVRKMALAELNRATADSPEYNKLRYAFSNNAEFMSHVLSNKNTIQFLNKTKYDGKQSLLNRIKDVFSKLWNALTEALGVSRGTLAEESVKRTLDVLLHNQLVTAQQTEFNPSALYSDLRNANIATKQITSIDKVVGKLEEQKAELISSYTGILDRKVRLDKTDKIQQIDADIKRLKESQDMMLVTEIGKKHLEWVARIDAKDTPNDNEIMTAINIGDMWRSIVDLMYGDEAASVDPALADLASRAGNMVQRLISKGKDYMIDVSAGVIRGRKDFTEVKDLDKAQVYLRSLAAAAKDRVTSHVANFIENTANRRDEDALNLMKRLNLLEKEMLEHVGNNKQALQALYNKMIDTSASSMGLTMQYSADWFDWRRKLIAKRNGAIADIKETYKDDEIGSLGPKKAAWKKFWAEVDSKAVFVNTGEFFDTQTGEFLADTAAARKKLAEQVGEDHVPVILARAQERYLQYIEDKLTQFEQYDGNVVSGERTAEEVETLKKEWQNKNSPNVFFDRANNARTYSEATEKYIVMAPKLSSTEMWNENYRDLQQDPKLSSFYNRFKAEIDELMSYLPKAIQDQRGANFLPVVRKELMTSMLGVKDWVKTLNEKFIRSLGASEWEEQMSDRMYNKIPVDFVDSKKTPLEDRSKDLIGMTRLFGMMAIHYKHFSAAKDYINMGSTILNEMNRSMVEGASQIEQNGKIVTVKEGLRNTLDALKYLTDYAMYRKPKMLEGKSNVKMYSKDEGKGQNFTVNPIKLKARSAEVERLMKQRDDLNERYEAEDTDMTQEQYEADLKVINDELGKYEGFTLFGSKTGDKLIGINQLKALSYNPFSAVANVTFGLISISIHAAGGRDFTRTEVGVAQKMMFQAMGNKQLALKILRLMDRTGVIGDYVDSKYGKMPEFRDHKAGWKKLVDPFSMMRISDYHMKGVSTLAIALHSKVELADGSKISVWDSLDENGDWDSAKHGEDPSWSAGTSAKELTKWDRFKNKVLKVNIILHGNQSKNSPKMINQNIIGRLVGQFRASWLPEGWYARYQAERYDENLDRQVKGRYRSFMEGKNQIGIGGYAMVLSRQLLGLIPGVKINPFSGITTNGGKLLTDEESVDMENMRRNLSEMGFFLVMAASIAMLKSLKHADDDKDPVTTMLINMLIRGKQDIDFYASPGVADAVTKNVIPATSVITDYGKAITATMRVLTDSDYEFNKWVLKMTKAGIPIPQTTLINKTIYMANKDLDALQ